MPNGDEPAGAERILYRITVDPRDGVKEEITVAALADLGDNDNNHLLCLNATSPATMVTFPAGHLVDPNGDLNFEAKIAVQWRSLFLTQAILSATIYLELQMPPNHPLYF